jgi:hypothetical protein
MRRYLACLVTGILSCVAGAGGADYPRPQQAGFHHCALSRSWGEGTAFACRVLRKRQDKGQALA